MKQLRRHFCDPWRPSTQLKSLTWCRALRCRLSFPINSWQSPLKQPDKDLGESGEVGLGRNLVSLYRAGYGAVGGGDLCWKRFQVERLEGRPMGGGGAEMVHTHCFGSVLATLASSSFNHSQTLFPGAIQSDMS